MADFEPITSQEQLDSIIKDRINRLNEKHSKEITEKYGDYDSLKENVSKYEKEIEKLNASITEAKEKLSNHTKEIAERDTKIKAFELNEIKMQVAKEKGLSYDAINFLQGTDEETISQSADALKSLVGVKTAPPVVVESGVENSEKSAYKGMLSNLF